MAPTVLFLESGQAQISVGAENVAIISLVTREGNEVMREIEETAGALDEFGADTTTEVSAGVKEDAETQNYPLRNGGINFNSGYFLPTYEVIYLIAKPRFKLAPRANALGDVWSIPQEKNNPHPAPFPLALAKRCLESVGTGPVLDPFLGSGTTAVAAKSLGMPWLGIDKSSAYCDLARTRLEAVTKNPW